MLHCPFCGTLETDRVRLEGQSYVVFGCLFTPRIEIDGPEEAVQERLRTEYGSQGTAYFRGVCDALHLHMLKALPAAGPTERNSGPA